MLSGNTIALEDQTLELRGLDESLPHRSYVCIPSIRTIAGGVNVYAGLNLWTADAQSVQERTDWSKLGAMAALQPVAVIPGHSQPGQKYDASQLASRQAYLTRYEQDLPKAANSGALI